MGVPKHRPTKSKQKRRRMHYYLEAPNIFRCPKCQKPVLGHSVCLNCGHYKGKMVIDVFKKLNKKEKKQKEKEMKEAKVASKKDLSMQELSK